MRPLSRDDSKLAENHTYLRFKVKDGCQMYVVNVENEADNDSYEHPLQKIDLDVFAPWKGNTRLPKLLHFSAINSVFQTALTTFMIVQWVWTDAESPNNLKP
jgi:hypothetical protein